MAQAYVDANVILRALTKDDPAASARAQDLFSSADAGQVQLLLAETTLAEVVWVLHRSYGHSRADIWAFLSELLAADGMQGTEPAVFQRALELFKSTRLNFADSLLGARAGLRGPQELYSFDRDFARVPGVRLLTPGQLP